MSKTLEAWGIKFLSRHAYTRNELIELIQSIDSQLVAPLRSQLNKAIDESK